MNPGMNRPRPQRRRGRIAPRTFRPVFGAGNLKEKHTGSGRFLADGILVRHVNVGFLCSEATLKSEGQVVVKHFRCRGSNVCVYCQHVLPIILL